MCMQTKVISTLVLCILFSGCSLKQDADGNINDLFVVSSPEDKEYIEPIIDKLFSKIIHTPIEENEINVIWKNAWDLDEVQNKYNIFILGIDNPADSTGDLLTQKFLEKNDQSQELFSIKDGYANNQHLIVLHAKDAIHFSDIVIQNQKWILEQYNTSIDKNVLEYVLEQGINKTLTQKIGNEYLENFEVQEDFEILKEDKDSFLWIGRGYPYRWLTFHKSNKAMFESPHASWLSLDSLFSLTLPDIKIGEFYKEFELVEIQSKKIKLLRGLYEHQKSESGGPFFVYIIETNEKEEVILASGFVNYPGHDKYFLLRQLEVIVKTSLEESRKNE